VYWNTKLGTEHQRIAAMFKPGEAVADVMAGIGPFAVPAGKNGVFVWANDKNPDSYKYLAEIIKRNKVSREDMRDKKTREISLTQIGL
jgi:tRNA (guanine37-N1)-methyltransferase